MYRPVQWSMFSTKLRIDTAKSCGLLSTRTLGYGRVRELSPSGSGGSTATQSGQCEGSGRDRVDESARPAQRPFNNQGTRGVKVARRGRTSYITHRDRTQRTASSVRITTPSDSMNIIA